MKVIWESVVPVRGGVLDGHIVGGSKLLLSHHDGEGLSCLDSSTGSELWTLRDSNHHFGRPVYSTEKSLILTGLDTWFSVDCDTGQYREIGGLKDTDSFVAGMGDLLLFEDVDPEEILGIGWILVDLSTGSFEKGSGPGALLPSLGAGSMYLGKVETEELDEFHIGEIASLRDADWREKALGIDAPEIGGYPRTGKFGDGSSGFWIGSSKQTFPANFYDWSGKQFASLVTEDFVSGGFDRMSVSPLGRGEGGAIFFGSKRETRERVAVICGNLQDPRDLVIVGTPGLSEIRPIMCGDDMIWRAETKSGDLIYRLRPAGVEAEVLQKDAGRVWLCGAGQRIFFGEWCKTKGKVVCASLE